MLQAGQLAPVNTSFVSARDAVLARVEQTAQDAASVKARAGVSGMFTSSHRWVVQSNTVCSGPACRTVVPKL